jgi:lipid-A-disaccharide synthase
MRSEAELGSTSQTEPLKLFLIAGEHSGDALGAKLIEGLRAKARAPLIFSGVGG